MKQQKTSASEREEGKAQTPARLVSLTDFWFFYAFFTHSGTWS